MSAGHSHGYRRFEVLATTFNAVAERRSARKCLLLIGIGVCAAACTTPYEGRYDFYDSWLKGKVVEIGTAQGLSRAAARDCRKDGTARSADTRYAYVRYRGVSRFTSSIVPIAAGSSLKPGDLVYVKIDDCNAPLPLRAEQTGAW